MGIVEQYLLQLNTQKQRFRRSIAVLSVLSLLVIMTVSWNLRQTGIAIANDACCGYEEHQHTETCVPEKILICGFGAESPTEVPTEVPTEEATEAPTEAPAEEVTEAPTEAPAEEATEAPTEAPVEEATEAPTEAPAEEAAEAPTEAPAEEATETPTEAPVEEATEASTEVHAKTSAEIHTTGNSVMQSEESDVPTSDESEESSDSDHVHSDDCYETVWSCGLEDHIHELACYSDLSANLEDWDIWKASIPELTGNISEDIVLVALSQLGNTESTMNFMLADDGETQNGITRYGQWYGNPYGPWSNMFTSFCLRFAGIEGVPVNSGAEKMRMEWEKLNIYRHAGGYEPISGDIIFFDKNQNGTPESTGVVIRYFDFILTVIEGDVDNAVVQTEYRIDDPVITGYGITNAANRVMMFASGAPRASITIGTTRNNSPTATGTYILYATVAGKSYAIDGNGNAVPIEIKDGNIIADVADPTTLYWVFTGSNNSYTIQNTSTKKYLYPSANGLISTQNQKATISNNKLRGSGTANNGYYIQLTEDGFGRVKGQTNGAVINFGNVPAQYTLWLDGTCGNLISYRGASNTAYTVYSGMPVQLPTELDKNPDKYQYKLAGWVDISNGEYYEPGDTITVTKNTVLYADWVAATYDIGTAANSVKTISTNDFITTQLFDYSALINIHSTSLDARSTSVSATSHSEKWVLAETGTAASGNTTHNFVFVEEYYNEDGYNDAGHLSVPTDRGTALEDPNVWTGGTDPFPGILSIDGKDIDHPLVELLFGSSDAVGKHYLGTADYLFQINNDPTDTEHYGYYYYDSRLNAASYNQSEQRFFVYNYLEASSDSEGNGEYSDFLPLNSPTVNTANGNVAAQKWGNDVPAQYQGDTYYEYESKYEAGNGMTRAEWFYGMRTDIRFDLPDPVGSGGNKDLYGKDMHFQFTGDDDVWILIDGEVVLDLGGIHTAASGDINFTTGKVYVNGVEDTAKSAALKKISSGDHTLTILYLERGASMGNCAIYFNLAPRFSLTLQKEDVLTQEALKDKVFTFYQMNDQGELEECYLWTSKEAYGRNDREEYKCTFTTDSEGQFYVWGLSPSQTYYIRETPPAGSTMEPMNGIIKLTLDKNGLNSTGATILPDGDEGITNGFTVHGFRIDEANQAVYLTVTNAQNPIQYTTSVYVDKKWNDTVDHTYDSITVYLQVYNPNDGTVKVIRQIDLSKENNWNYTWTNLPKYPQIEVPKLDENGNEVYDENGKKVTEIVDDTAHPLQYSVSESYKEGYQQTESVLQSGTITENVWAEATELSNGGDYILKIGQNQYLSIDPENTSRLKIVTKDEAKSSAYALWRVTVSGSNYRLDNTVTGRSLNFNNGNNNSYRYFNVIQRSGNANTWNLVQTPYNSGILLSYKRNNTTNYYLDSINESTGYADSTTQQSSALVIYPIKKSTYTNTAQFDGTGYRIWNSPVVFYTSVEVEKKWDTDSVPANSNHLKEEITVKLLADGVFTGKTAVIDRTTEWKAKFEGLPIYGDDDHKIVYTVEEVPLDDWIPSYGPDPNNPGRIIITNHYRWIDAVELPSTGGIGESLLILIGLILISAPFVYGFSLRRKYERRLPE